MMHPLLRPRLLAALVAAAGAQAQGTTPPQPAPVAPAVDLRSLCADLPPAPAEARQIAQRGQCVLQGVLPSERRHAEARELGRRAMAAGEPAGGLLLYLAFRSDPAWSARQDDGQVDLEAYRRLAALPAAQRQEQVEAIEGLAFAAGRNHPDAGTLLALYFYETVAPRNVSRARAMAQLLEQKGHRPAALQKIGREAATIERAAGATKASVRSFFGAYRLATAAALAGHATQTAGGKCSQAELQSASSGDVEGAEYLPLKGPMVADSYLVKGRWNEYWTFRACGEDVPVKVSFTADGWGGSSFTATHNKGE